METPATRMPSKEPRQGGTPPEEPLKSMTSRKKPRDIDVSLTANGLEIDNDPECVMQGSKVIWRFKRGGIDAARARITFKEGVKFFPKHQPPNWDEVVLQTGNETLEGEAPNYFSAGPARVQSDKYSIELFDDAGGRVAFVDPDIRTNGP